MKPLESPIVETILKVFLPFLTLCGLLHMFGYWSTFHIDIFTVMDFQSLLTAFLYPFFDVYFLVLIMISFFLIVFVGDSKLNFIVKTDFAALHRTSNYKVFYKGFVYPLLFLLTSGIASFLLLILHNVGLMMLAFWISFLLAYVAVQTSFLQTTFPSEILRAKVLILVFGSLSMAFVTGKGNAYDVLNSTSRFTVTVSFKDSSNQNDTLSVIKDYKLLGLTSEFTFLLELDNSSVYTIPSDEIYFLKKNIYPFNGYFKQHWKDDVTQGYP